MDPQATWNSLQKAYGRKEWQEARELARSLLDWLHRDGFPPFTGNGDPTDMAEQRGNATRFCRLVIDLTKAK
jgi:hypothetical protein